jgi:type II secretory pathway component PulK
VSAPATPSPRRPRGIALLMALVVVMLLTFFMSEYFFATGLELSGMTHFKEGEQARSLARSVFKVVQIGLLNDEVEFFRGYRQVSQLLTVASIPWDKGLLLKLEIEPQDHLFNLNQTHNVRQGEASDIGRRNLFMATMKEVEVPAGEVGLPPEPLNPEVAAGLYAALYDWVDGDDETYIQFTGVNGAEADAYFGTEPEYAPKNAMLDRLAEIRLVRGVPESRIPWTEWEKRFTGLPRVTTVDFYFTEKINVNTAGREELLSFLKNRWVDATQISESGKATIQKGINEYADRAEEIAGFFAPEVGEERKVYTAGSLKPALKDELQLNDNYGVNYLLSTVNQYYRISLVTEVNEVLARLEGMVQVTRDPDTRTGTSSKVLWLTLQ